MRTAIQIFKDKAKTETWLNKFRSEELSVIIKIIREAQNEAITEQNMLAEAIEEGSACWKMEYDDCRAILSELVELKDYKDQKGKDEHYLKTQPLLWEKAKHFLKQYTHLSF